MMTRTVKILTTLSLLVGLTQANAATDPGAAIYRNECSQCHVAYPTQFLPTASWDAVMNNLADHFGDNAELSAEDTAAVKLFLDRNNYDQSRIKRRYGNRFDTQGTPLRLTKTRFFRAIHNEVSDRYVTQNPKVKTFARCEACHGRAQNGRYDEDEVRIPR
jgi:cytochrome c553